MRQRAPARLAIGVLAALLISCSGEDGPRPDVTTGDTRTTPSAVASTGDGARAASATTAPGASPSGTGSTAASVPGGPGTVGGGTPSAAPGPGPSAGQGGGTPAPLGGPAGGPGGQTVGLDCVAPVLKRHPIDLAPYDAASGRAGDAAFKRPLFLNRVYTEFGFVIPAATTSTGNDKPNPQPTYLAPMGTKVRSAVDGVVDRISDLWSTPTLGDVSVMVKPDGLPGRCYVVVEFEHVVKPTVRAGDRVTAGQVIAEVGPLNSQGSAGLGLVEFGILTGSGNGRPLHVCPYAYFDPGVRSTQLAILGRLMADWEAYFGDTTLYNEAAWAAGITGCRSGPIEE